MDAAGLLSPSVSEIPRLGKCGQEKTSISSDHSRRILWQNRRFHQNVSNPIRRNRVPTLQKLPGIAFLVGGMVVAGLYSGQTLLSISQAQPPETPPAAGAPTGEPAAEAAPTRIASDKASTELLAASRQQLIANAYRTKIAHTLHLGLGSNADPGNNLRTEGLFVHGLDLKTRLEFKIELGGTTGTMLQVCDGEILWTEQRIGDTILVRRCDARQILDSARQILDSARQMPRHSQTVLKMELGLGGIAGLLASLQNNMGFATPGAETVGGEELTVIRGVWHPEYLTELQKNLTSKKAQGLPMPMGATIWFDSNKFPRRIQYTAPVEKDGDQKPMLTLDFEDIEFVEEKMLSADLFQYSPPQNVYQQDVTDKYIRQLQAPVPQTPPPAKPPQ